MTSLKVQCPCGQKFAFDAEPVNGRLPSPVECPACGKDATQAANEQLAALAAPAAPPAPAPKRSRKGLLLGIGIAALLLLIAAAGLVYWLFQPEIKPAPAPARPERVVGIGVIVSRDPESGQYVVRRTFPNSPAANAGIAAGLVLYKVDGALVETNTIGQLSRLLVGPVGTKVVLELVDPQAGTTNQMELVREPFENRSK